MTLTNRLPRVLAYALVVVAATAQAARAQAPSPNDIPREIAAFNHALADATRRMDNATTVALWADDGISLLPSTPPITGKAAIAAFIDGVTKSLPGAHMLSFTLDCHDVEVAGAWASEWCTEHQVVAIPDRPNFDGWGNMLFVLHRDGDGRWRIAREMWNEAAPATARR